MIITNRLHSKSGLTALFLTLAAATSLADEGMWLFNQPPRALLKEKYNFEPSTAWLDHLQQASVRFNSGGSGSFVSEDGLVMSNHHVGADALQKLGDKDHNYLRDGFFARTLAEEKRCHDLELNVLVSIEDVTDRVNAAVKTDMIPEQAFLARRKVIAEIEKESLDRTGLRSDVVTLYQGGQYHLYRFKRYTDVRLVFAPEQQIAFFGGDPDNFEYPRYDLDICFFRVYENGKPARIPHWLRWSRAGAAENELIFVSGHPGRTARLLTLAEIEYQRDVLFPETLAWLHRREVLLTAYGARSEENARRARDDLLGVQNSRKAREGGLAGLLDPAFIASKQAAERALKNAVAQDPKYANARDAWDRIAAAQRVISENAPMHRLLESGRGFNCELFGIARTLLRAADERPKPDGERLSEFRESGRASLELNLFSTKPIYDDYEQLCLADSLTFLAERLGARHPIVERVLVGKSPRQRAAELVKDTKVKDVAFRRKLYEGGKAAVDAARDPMIELARAVDAEARAVRQIIETQEEIKRQAHAQIAAARFAIQGTSTYPDATFTLRLAFGVVKGYDENGKHVPCQTTFAGLYERSREQGGRPPFDLPERWIKARRRLDLNTPLNFVSTADIIGGNSGSPVVNKNGELVGIIFDGNIQSLVLDFYYTEEQARALAVHSSAITHALRRVYGANRLADELEGRRRR
ncbi:MAG: S46 family peptidase [Verrucomicrobia bacterium]|nr:S46 family peptidase [Verrucomicrobiota bacterium]